MLDPSLRRAAVRALLGLFLGQPALAETTVRVVARTGQSAPGTGPFATFHSFELPCINGIGRAAFVATIEGAVLQGGPTGIWAEDGAFALRHPAHSAVEAPGTGGDDYDTPSPFSGLVWGGEGTLYFRGELALSAAHTSGIFADGVAIALANEPVPGLPAGLEFTSVGVPAASGGSVAFRSPVGGLGAPGSAAVYVVRGGQMALVARTGDPAPGTFVEFDDFGEARITANERVGFAATTDFATTGAWIEGNSGLQAIPGLPNFAEILDTSFNAGGDVLIGGRESVAFDQNHSLWSGPRNAIEELARWGETPSTFMIFRGYALDSHGRVTLLVDFGQDDFPFTDTGIWAGTPGDLDPIVRDGDDAPGTNGAVFEGPSMGQSAFSSIAVAPDGDFAFVGWLSGGDTSSGNDRGVWRRIDGELELMMRKGDLIELAPGVFETLQGAELLNSFGSTSGQPSSMNVRDQFAMRLTFLNGGEAIVVVPEPGAALLAFAALALLLALRVRSSPRSAGSSGTTS